MLALMVISHSEQLLFIVFQSVYSVVYGVLYGASCYMSVAPVLKLVIADVMLDCVLCF